MLSLPPLLVCVFGPIRPRPADTPSATKRTTQEASSNDRSGAGAVEAADVLRGGGRARLGDSREDEVVILSNDTDIARVGYGARLAQVEV